MSQLPLQYPGEAWRRVLHHLRNIAHRVTPKVAAAECDTSPSLLRDALDERDRKGVRAECCLSSSSSPPPRSARSCSPISHHPFGFEIVKPKKLTPEQRLARLEAEVENYFGVAGRDVVARSRR